MKGRKDMNKELKTIEELRNDCARLHPDTYRRLFREGAIPAEKIDGVWYSTEKAVIEYIERDKED